MPELAAVKAPEAKPASVPGEKPKPFAEAATAYNFVYALVTGQEVKDVLKPSTIPKKDRFATDTRTPEEIAKDNLQEALDTDGGKYLEDIEMLENFEKAVTAGTATKDSQGKYTGEFSFKLTIPILKDGKEITEIKGNVTNHYAGAIRGLERAIDATAGRTDEAGKKLHQQTQEALDKISPNVQVVTDENGQQQTYTYKEWRNQRNQEAVELWKKTRPSGTLPEFQDDKQVTPLERSYYQSQAVSKPGRQVSYKLVYAEETTTKEEQKVKVEAVTNPETRKKNALAAAQEVEQAVISAGGKDDIRFTNLVYWHSKLVTGEGDTETLVSLVTSGTRGLATHHKIELTDNNATQLEGNETFYKDNDPVRRFTKEQMKGLGISDRLIDQLMDNTEVGKVALLIQELGPAITRDREKLSNPQTQQEATNVSNLITRLTGTAITGEEAHLIRSIKETGQLESFRRAFAKQLGLNADKPLNLREHLKGKASTIAINAHGGETGYSPDAETVQKIEALVNLSDAEIAKLANEKGFSLSWIMYLAIGLQLIQGTLDIGTPKQQE